MGKPIKTVFTRLLVLTLSVFILSQGSIYCSFDFGKKTDQLAQNSFSENFFSGLINWLYQEHLETGENPLTSDSPEQDSDEEDSEENKKEGAKNLTHVYGLNLLFLCPSRSCYKDFSISNPFITIFSPPPEIA